MKVRFRLVNRGTAAEPHYENPSMINVRFQKGLARTMYRVDPKHWNFPKPVKRGRRPDPNQGLKKSFKPVKLTKEEIAKGYKTLSEVTLSEITAAVQRAHLNAPKTTVFDSEWLKGIIDEYNGVKKEEIDFDYFDNLLTEYLYKKEPKYRPNGEPPQVTRLKEFQGNNRLKSEELDKAFSEKYTEWMLKQGFLPGYVKAELARFRRALRYGLDYKKLNYRIYDWTTIKDKKPRPITLTADEVETLSNYECPTESEENIKRIFLCSCYSSLRFSDVLKLNDAEGDSITIKQRKTGDLVTIPIHPRIKEILKDHKLKHITLSYYCKAIKRICEDAGINAMVEGRLAKTGGKTIVAPKYQFIGSHTGRRTFVTMYINKMPISRLRQVTGHKTDSSLLKYIGYTENDHVEIWQNMWEMEGK